jgi:hypothetical protein
MAASLTLFLSALTKVQAALVANAEPGEHLDAETLTTLRTILADERLLAAMRVSAMKPDSLKALERVKGVFAGFASDLGAPFSGAMPIASLRKPLRGRAYLLYCPDQGGWTVGEPRGPAPAEWVAVVDTAIQLRPTHWMPAPIDPE